MPSGWVRWVLLMVLALAGPAMAQDPAGPRAPSLLDQLSRKSEPAPGEASKYAFSGIADVRFADGGDGLTPLNVNNQGTTGGISSFFLARLHLFMDAVLSPRTRLFVKLGAGSADQARFILDAVALTLNLGEGWPHLEVGRLLNPFGRFPQRFLAPDNPLIGDPLIYGTPLSLSSGQLPASAADLLGQRGRGLNSQFAGYAVGQRGLPVVSNFWYVNGLKLGGQVGDFTYALGLVNESVSSVDFFDPNDDKSLVARVSYKPDAAWTFGASLASSAYLTRDVFRSVATLPFRLQDQRQRTAGLDVEFTQGHFSLFGEYVHSGWDSPRVLGDLTTNGFFVEPRYRVMPGLTLALRWDRMEFSDITGAAGPAPWEFDLGRVEAGAIYTIERDVLVKATHQWNSTGAPTGDPSDDVLLTQLCVSF